MRGLFALLVLVGCTSGKSGETGDSGGGTTTVDADGDGYPEAVDCEDGDGAINPGAVDTPDDGIDQDYDYRTDFSLDNDAETLVLSYGATTLDTVAYDDTNFFPDETGYSMSLDSDHTSADENDSGQYWCDGASTYGDGDYGTPGEANAACPDMDDADGDGWVAAHDCDDAKSSVYPGATEAARDSTDSDCDGADGYAQSMRSGELLIDEIMQNPDLVGDADGEWFEFYNNTSYSWNLYGLTVKDATGTDVFTVDEDVIITTHQYVVFAVNGDATKNGGVTIVDYDYPGSTFSLSNGSDGIYLYPSSTSTTVIDSVAWDNGVAFPDPTGASMSLKTTGFDATKNNTGSYWCTSTSNIASDPLNDLGTPGAKNDAC